MPATMYMPHRLLRHSYDDLVDKLGLPFVMKPMAANGGRHTYLIGNERKFAEHLSDSAHVDARFLAQEFIPSDTRRSAGSEALLDPTDFDPAVKRLVVRAAALLCCDVVGVNVIQHWTTRQWYVLDATSSPAIGTGAFVEHKLGAYSSYLKRRLTG